MEGVRDVFGDAVGAIDLRDPLRHRTEHAPVIDLLESFALDDVVADLPDEENHRRRILVCGVYAERRVRSTRASRHHADAGTPRELAVSVGHVGGAAFL